MNAYENKANETQAYEALRLAQMNADNAAMKSSATHCAQEAERFFNEGRFGFAHEWSLMSLRYSVGDFNSNVTRLRQERKGV